MSLNPAGVQHHSEPPTLHASHSMTDGLVGRAVVNQVRHALYLHMTMQTALRDSLTNDWGGRFFLNWARTTPTFPCDFVTCGGWIKVR